MMLEHFLVEVAAVPFPYGAPVETGSGTTVAVLTMTGAELDEPAASLLASEETAAEEPDPALVAAAVSV